MRRSALTLLAGVEIGILSLWLLGTQFETGQDALQYHRMANAIVVGGLAPWTLNPLSYIGLYPGSDSSGVPFLVASISIASGIPISVAVLVYDAALILTLGLGLFILAERLTKRTDLAFLALLMGSLAYGMLSALSWRMDERSINVALTPVFLLLALPQESHTGLHRTIPRFAALGLVSLLMLVSHLNFLLLLPFLVVTPLIYGITRRQLVVRRKRWTSLLYFGAIGLSPLFLLTALNQIGVLGNFGLDYSLENSAFFSGASSFVLVANALIFLGTRVGPVNVGFGIVGLLYLATRSRLLQRDVLMGALLLSVFLGLPIVVYSKDLLMPVLVLIGVVGLRELTARSVQRQTAAVVLAAIVIVSGSVAFDAWNSARTTKSGEAGYWAPPGVTSEMKVGNLWIHDQTPGGCAYGNNPVLLQQVTNEPGIAYCTGLSIDVTLNEFGPARTGAVPIQVEYIGITGISPAEWFTSPELTRASTDFALLPGLTFQAGRALLAKYNITIIVVDLEKPYDIPLFNFQGTAPSTFFADLWNNLYPVYRSGTIAVFSIG